MDIKYISVSRAGVFEECQQKYKFRYHLKVEPPVPQQPYFTFGSVVHKIIEEHTLSEGKENIHDISKKVLWGDIPIDKDSEIIPRKDLPDAYLKRLPKMIDAYLKLSKKIGFDGECEWKFNYDLDQPNEKCVYGFIDRLIKKDGKYIIIDYKTSKKSKWRKNKRDIVGDLQLQCYSMVVANYFDVDPSNVYAALYYLEGEEFIGAQFNRETLEKTKQVLLDTYNRIQNIHPDKAWGRVGQQCKRCDYKSICPFYSLT